MALWVLPFLCMMTTCVLQSCHSFVFPLIIENPSSTWDQRRTTKEPQKLQDTLPLSLLHATTRDDTTSATTIAWTSNVMTRQEGQDVMNKIILPQENYGGRIASGGDAQGLWDDVDPSFGNRRKTGGPVEANDPRTQFTYGEFPLESFDALVDLGLTHLKDSTERIEMVDIGSGCGRLALYAALTRGNNNMSASQQPWTIHGIEISSILCNVATDALQTGIDQELLQPAATEQANAQSDKTMLCLHEGPVEQFPRVLSKCDVLFMYSTVFASKGFSPELGAMILDESWSALLAESCRDGCIAITTDRALDPTHGWQLVDRLDVENREVMGSTGFLNVLRK